MVSIQFLNLTIVYSKLFYVEERYLFKQLEPVRTGHDQTSRCMKGTRETILKRIMEWVSDTQYNAQERNRTPKTDIDWVYGSPGNRKNVLSSFGLRKSSRSGAARWSLFLPEG